MANVNIPDLAALTAPAATDAIEVYDASAAANVRLALSYVALTGTANVFTANQTIDAGYRLNVDTATRVQQAVGGAYFLKNAIWNGSAWEYVTTASAATVGLPVNGGIQLRIAASGTAGNPITWTTAVTLNTTGHLLVGTATDGGQLTVNGEMALVDGMTAPGTTSGWAKIYVDSADGDLKVKFGDGTVKTLATDT